MKAVCLKEYGRRVLRRLVATLVMGAAAAGVTGAEARAATAAPADGGTLTVGLELELRGFDAIRTGYLGVADRSVISAIEERLFDMDGKGNLVPELGLSANSSRDGKSWTVKLRKGVSFHDGTPFNADAVVSHWQRLLDPANRFFALNQLQPVTGVAKVDDYTVRFTLKHTWASFKSTISSPVGIVAFIPSPKAVREGTQERGPVGTGPFMFREWKTNDRLVVVRNPRYWRKGTPHLDSVVFRPMPDMQARFAALQAGEVDVIQTDRGASIKQAKGDPALRVYASDATGAYSFIINTSKPPLDDVRVRRALAHAWNQELLVKADYKDTLPLATDPFSGLLGCGTAGYREYDTAKARKLLAEYGRPVTVELLHTNTARGKEAGEIMQRLFKEVGVTLKLVPVAETQMVKRVVAGDYQISGWRFMDFPDMGPYLYSSLFSDSRQNFTRYRNSRLDELLTLQNTTLDTARRKKALCGAANIINDDVLYLYGGGRRFHLIAKAAVEGVTSADHGIVRVADFRLKGR